MQAVVVCFALNKSRTEMFHDVLFPDDSVLWHPSGYSQRSMVLVRAQTHRQR